MLVGYARVSKNHQDVSIQLDALKRAGCQLFFIDKSDGVKKDYPGVDTTLNHMRAGDILIVWRLERLGRSLKHLVDIVNHLAEREIGFQSLQESIDTTIDDGQVTFQIFATLAEFQRNTMREQTLIGLQAARARGRNGGRPKALDDEKTALLYKLYDEKRHTIQELCQLMGVTKTTLYNYMRERQKT